MKIVFAVLVILFVIVSVPVLIRGCLEQARRDLHRGLFPDEKEEKP